MHDEPLPADAPPADLLDDDGVAPREPREPLRPISPLVESDLVEGDYLAARIWTA